MLNSEGANILQVAVAYDLPLISTFFQKRKNHPLICKSGRKKSQIDYFPIRRNELKNFRDSRVNPGGICYKPVSAIGSRPLLLKQPFRRWARREPQKIRQWKLERKLKEGFKMEVTRKMTKEDWNRKKDEVWEQMSSMIIRNARGLVGETEGMARIQEETWW
ncbi:unnamed protein product [Soboliphyme baturini]|uniref:Mitoc_mL59 domain-containing protein n=1 Tax=Soboliphyme baturini TaxID=241478 RepID=A0A183J0U4_9BILA|nr:unnamed protein product [Soboliphyme baturini]